MRTQSRFNPADKPISMEELRQRVRPEVADLVEQAADMISATDTWGVDDEAKIRPILNQLNELKTGDEEKAIADFCGYYNQTRYDLTYY